MPPKAKEAAETETAIRFRQKYDDAATRVAIYREYLARQPQDRLKLIERFLSGQDLSGTDLSELDLRNANLDMCNFGEADLSEADLRRASLRSCDFSETNLFHVDLREADLSYSQFFSAEMEVSDLRGANLTGVVLTDTNMEGTQVMADAIKDLDLSMVRGKKDIYIVGESKMVTVVEKEALPKEEPEEDDNRVCCHYCKDYYPEQEMYLDPDEFYCCEDCKEEHFPDQRLLRY